MIIFLKNRIPEMLKKELKRFIDRIIKPSPKSPRKLCFLLNSNSTELELHKGTQEKSYLSVLSIKSMIMLDV